MKLKTLTWHNVPSLNAIHLDPMAAHHHYWKINKRVDYDGNTLA